MADGLYGLRQRQPRPGGDPAAQAGLSSSIVVRVRRRNEALMAAAAAGGDDPDHSSPAPSHPSMGAGPPPSATTSTAMGSSTPSPPARGGMPAGPMPAATSASPMMPGAAVMMPRAPTVARPPTDGGPSPSGRPHVAGGGSGGMDSLLTQAAAPAAAAAGAAGGHLAPLPPTSGASPSAVARGRVVDPKKLAEWRAKPMNRSPATAAQLLNSIIPPPLPEMRSRVTLVLDIDETLVHASFTPAKPYNVRLLVELENERGYIYVAFRPHMSRFLNEVANLFEIVIFTASQACYADQLMDYIDQGGRLGRMRLFRQHCTEIQSGRVKDLSLLGRPLDRIAIIDNSPVAYAFQPRNAIPIESWFDDPTDSAFVRMMPMLKELARATSVYDVLDPWNCSVAVTTPRLSSEVVAE